MKYFLTTLAVFSALASLFFLTALIYIFVVFGSGFNVVLPGLGLVISGSVILALLFLLGLVTLALTVLLLRMIYKPLR